MNASHYHLVYSRVTGALVVVVVCSVVVLTALLVLVMLDKELFLAEVVGGSVGV